MKAKLINQKPKTFVLVFNTGEEVVAKLKEFASAEGLEASHFSAIGAFSDLTLGYFNIEKKDYEKIPLKEQVEVLSLLGNITKTRGEPKIHAHVVVGKSDGAAHGGHLLEARVRPTLEVIIEESPAHLKRKQDEATGLALIDLEG